MGAEYSSYVKTIATFALTLFGYIISVLASVRKFIYVVTFYFLFLLSIIFEQ